MEGNWSCGSPVPLESGTGGGKRLARILLLPDGIGTGVGLVKRPDLEKLEKLSFLARIAARIRAIEVGRPFGVRRFRSSFRHPQHQTMRLTLRTLLAYRDQVLDAKDTEILEQRLRESQTARTISDRINNLMSNPGVAPIDVDATEFGLNANDVASFLDDTMAMDRIVEMERKCLDRNPLLADVASCHRILAEVLRNPTQAAPGLRHRVSALASRRNGDASSPLPGSEDRRLREDPAHRSVQSPLGLSVARNSAAIKSVGMPDRVSVESESPATPIENPSSGRIPDYLQKSERQHAGPAVWLLLLLIVFAVCAAQSLGTRKRLMEMLDRQTSEWSSNSGVPPTLEPNAR